MPNNQARSDQGFSLIETVLALLVFSLLASILLPSALFSAQRLEAERQSLDTSLALQNKRASALLGLTSDSNQGVRKIAQEDPSSGISLVSFDLQAGGSILQVRAIEAKSQ